MKKIVMTKSEVKAEHKRLIPILEKGSKKQRKAEATKQKGEMKEYGIHLNPAYHK